MILLIWFVKREMTDKNGSVKTIIKGRELIFYLANEQDLKEIKGLSIQSNILLSLSILLFGGSISGIIAKASAKFSDDGIKFLDLLIMFFVVIAVIFLVMSIYSERKSYKRLEAIISSGEVTSYSKLNKPKAKFEILKAIYGIGEGQNLDLTKKLSDLIKDDQLVITIPYNHLGGDPYPQKKKMLQIDYIFEGNQLSKSFLEDQTFNLP